MERDQEQLDFKNKKIKLVYQTTLHQLIFQAFFVKKVAELGLGDMPQVLAIKIHKVILGIYFVSL